MFIAPYLNNNILFNGAHTFNSIVSLSIEMCHHKGYWYLLGRWGAIITLQGVFKSLRRKMAMYLFYKQFCMILKLCFYKMMNKDYVLFHLCLVN